MSSKRSYTEDFKQGAVDLIVNEGLSAGEVGRRLGINRVAHKSLSVNKAITIEGARPINF